MIETPRGVLNAVVIARAHRRVSALVVGTSDLSNVGFIFKIIC
jgi:citrate lyase beta subunit